MTNAQMELFEVLKLAAVMLPTVEQRQKAMDAFNALDVQTANPYPDCDMASVLLYNPDDPSKRVEIPMIVLNEIRIASSKIHAIKILRDRMGIGLREARLTIEHPGNALGFAGDKSVVDPGEGRRYYLNAQDFEAIRAAEWPTAKTQDVLGVIQVVASRIVRYPDNGLDGNILKNIISEVETAE